MNQPLKDPNDPFIGKETALVGLIISHFEHSKTYYLDRINSGLAKQLYGEGIIHLAKTGTPDIVGMHRVEGYVIWIECKVGKNKLRKSGKGGSQTEFAKMVRQTKHGVYILARSLDDVLDVLEPREEMPF